MCGARNRCAIIRISDGSPVCNCYSDCYDYGDCCADISNLDNCSSTAWIVCLVSIHVLCAIYIQWNLGHVGTRHFVLYREVVLSLEVKNLLV